DARLGYVDQTGQLAIASFETPDGSEIAIDAYPNADAAQAALEQDHIDGYLVIPEGYFQGETPRFYSQEAPGMIMQERLAGFIRQALLADQPGWVAERFSDPAELIYVARATGEVVEGPGVLVQIVTPLVLAMAFGLLVLTGSGQMGAAIVEEKDQRAMEIVITSLAPRELVMGKILGITLLTVTQAAIWATGAGIAVGLALAAAGGGVPLNIPWRAVSWALLLGVPGYFLYAVLAAGLGIIAGDRQQARQLSGLLGFLGLMPLYFIGLLINAMDGPLALGLTWFPLTAPMIALFRMALSPVPTWQLIVSLVILIASVAGSVWFVVRIFRAAMLAHGQSLRPRQIWRALRQR
ncbi:MAG: ABC transporter permease, partial [Anaerolineae bacterium]|nr:ABC transporter permease [Anaerolineae bacterium]